MKRILSFIILGLLVSGGVLHAEEKIQLEKENIIGNEEAPKALYVVPWRPITPVGVAGLEIQSMLDEELELVDPESFRRKVELFQIKQAAKAK